MDLSIGQYNWLFTINKLYINKKIYDELNQLGFDNLNISNLG